jgi:hypothetical protein
MYNVNPMTELLDQFESIKLNFERLSKNIFNKNKNLNMKVLTSKDFELAQNQLMNYFNDIAMNKENIPIIVKAKLDLHTWNMLTSRTSIVLKHKIEPTHMGKNFQLKIQNLYSTIIEDLRNNFQFFRNIYSIVSSTQDRDLNVLVSNVLNFMGDGKKLKLMLNQKFNEFKDIINIEGDLKKDANDCLRFYNYALNNNPYNNRIFSNLGFVYREFLGDHLNSAYWFIRAISCVDNELKKVKDNLDKEFNSIRKKFLSTDYNVEAEKVSFLKYDIDYLPVVLYRMVGILYLNIDVDTYPELLEKFQIILEKILKNYSIVPDINRFNWENNGWTEQMVILGIFNFHYNLNALADYPNEPEKVICNKGNTLPPMLNAFTYNHKIMNQLQENKEIKNSIKHAFNFLTVLIKTITINMNEDNVSFVEKCLVMLFFWLSLNYDVYQIIVDDEMKKYLKFFNFFIQNDYDIKRIVSNPPMFKDILTKINTMILPIESTFFGFIPLNRYFVLNKKFGILKAEDIKEHSVFNKLTLIHFLDSFNLTAENSEEVGKTFFKKIELNVTEVSEANIDISSTELKNRLLVFNKQPILLNVRKVKPLILLDACNIAMRHGDSTFSTKGIQIVMDYFTKNGHKVLSFLPEYLFKSKEGNQNYAKKKRVVPDDIEYLKQLYSQALVVQTPPQDYDDTYCIQHAKENNAYIVSNDMFRDYVDKFIDNRKRETERLIVKDKLISFTFNGNEFKPNPNSPFFTEFDIDVYSAKSKGQV